MPDGVNPLGPDLGAHLDQIGRSLEDWAKLVATYYKSLVAQGVPPEHAAQLAVAWQNAIIAAQIAAMIGQAQQGQGD